MENHQGHLVPVKVIKKVDLLRHEVVMELAKEAEELRAKLAAFKAKAFANVTAFVETAAEEYNVKKGGAKGHVTLMSYDGLYKVQRSNAPSVTFTEGIAAAKTLIDECLVEWSAGANANLQKVVNSAFQLDNTGNYNVGRVLSLRNLDITDEPRWETAMQAISEAVKVIESKTYIRLYKRNAQNGYDPISLDLATV